MAPYSKYYSPPLATSNNKSIKMMTSRNLTALGRAGKGFRPKVRARKEKQPFHPIHRCQSFTERPSTFCPCQEVSSNAFLFGAVFLGLSRFFLVVGLGWKKVLFRPVFEWLGRCRCLETGSSDIYLFSPFVHRLWLCLCCYIARPPFLMAAE